MARITTFARGTFKRGPIGSGSKGGKALLSDTGRQINAVVTGLKDGFASLKENEIKAALIEMGDEIVKHTTPLVPVKTGALRDSHEVTPDINVSNPKVNVSYGNAFVDYAVRVHEDMDVPHENPTGAQAKFLSTGAELAKSNFEAIMAKHLRKAIK